MGGDFLGFVLDICQKVSKRHIFDIVLVLNPCDIEARLVAGQEFLLTELAPTPGRIFFAPGFLALTCRIALDKIVKVATLQGLGSLRMLYASAVIIEPSFLSFAASFKKEYVRLNAVRIKDSSRESKNCM